MNDSIMAGINFLATWAVLNGVCWLVKSPYRFGWYQK